MWSVVSWSLRMGSLAVWTRRANGLERLTRENHVGGEAISAEKATGICCRAISDEIERVIWEETEG